MLMPESYPVRNPGNAYGVIDLGKPKTWCLVYFPKAKRMNMYTVKSEKYMLTFMASSRNTT